MIVPLAGHADPIESVDYAGADDQVVGDQLPMTVQQAVAEALQEAAWNRTALDNIAVLVMDVRRCGASTQSPPRPPPRHTCLAPALAICPSSALQRSRPWIAALLESRLEAFQPSPLGSKYAAAFSL